MMKKIQSAFILTGLCLSTVSFAAQPTDKTALKQAAHDTCLAKAIEVYGTATAKSKATKKKIGRVKGYSFTLKVGESNKRVKCLADENGETVFYGRSR